MADPNSTTLDKLKSGLNVFGSRVRTGSAAAGKTLSEQATVLSGRMKELFYTPTPADRLVDDATAETLEGPDWGKNVEIFDKLNGGVLNSGDVVRAIKRRLLVKNSRVQVLSLMLLESSAKNCDRIFAEISNEKVLDEMVKIADDPLGFPEVRDKCLKLIEAWGEATNDLRYLPAFEETYKSLKSRGIRFPGRDNESLAPIFTPPATHPVTQAAAQDAPIPPLSEDPKEALAVARNTVELLNTVLTSAPPQEALQDELTPTLVSQCRQSQTSVQHIIETAGENETLLFEALSVHDELAAALKKYEEMRTGGVTGGGAEAGAARAEETTPAPLVAVSAAEEEEPPAGGEGEGLIRNRGQKAQGGDVAALDEVIFGKAGAPDAKKPNKKDDDDMIVF